MKCKRVVSAIMGAVLMAQVFAPIVPAVNAEAAVFQESISVFSDVYTDKSRYNPGDTVTITVELNNRSQSDIKKLVVQPMHLNQKAGEPIEVECSVTSFGKRTQTITWTAGSADFQGYMLEISAKDSEDNTIDTGSVAVDVSSDWTKFPRYGYVHEFEEDIDTASKIKEMTKYHINVVEYYDWHYRHHQPLAPQEMLAQGWYTDWAGRKIYVSTLENYIKNAKNSNMANMAYDMIYAGTDSFFQGEENAEHKDWQIYFKDGNDSGSGEFVFTMGEGLPDGHLYFVNPLNTDWQNYIFGQVNNALDYFSFDGWHGDTVGDWGEMVTADGEPLGYTEEGDPIYLVSETYKQFLDAAKDAINGRYLTFNPVGAKGIVNANKSKVDALYTEFWPWDNDRDGNQYNTYAALVREVERSAEDSGGKSLAVKSYINYNAKDGEGYMNTPAVMLVNAAAFASGGNRVEIGNGDHILHHEYYPNDNVLMSDTLKARMRNVYDFAVAYENLLRDGQTTTNQKTVIENYAGSSTGEADKIWTYTREGNGYQMLHLINLLGTDNEWRDADRTKLTPKAASDISVKYYYTGDVNSVYLASPDKNGGCTEALAFEKGTDADGAYVKFTVPSLDYWDMIYMSADEPTDLNESIGSGEYQLKYEAEDYYTGELAEGQANMQPGEAISFSVSEGIPEGDYELSVTSCGNRTSFTILLNDSIIGKISRVSTDFGINQMTDDALSETIHLSGGETITVKDVNEGSYGWVDKFTLTLKKLTLPNQDEHGPSYEYPEGMLYIVEAETGERHSVAGSSEMPEIEEYGKASGQQIVKNIGLNQGWVEVSLPAGVQEGKYQLSLCYSTSTNGAVNVWVNDEKHTVKYAKTNDSWSYIPGYLSIGSMQLKAGDKIKIQDANADCWIWADYIYLTTEIDTTALEEVIERAEALELENYQDGNAKNTFKAALENAKKVLEEKESQSAVDMAVGALNTAISAMDETVVEINTQKLANTIAETEALNLNNYKDGAVKEEFKATLAEAKNVLAAKESQSCVDEAAAALEKIRAMLEDVKIEIVEVDVTKLQEAITKAEAIALGDYQDGNAKNTFISALKNAKAALAAKESQTKVNEALAALNTATTALEKDKVTSGGTTPTNPGTTQPVAPKQYKVTYKLNGGKNSSGNPKVCGTKKIVLKNPARKGYTFKGWYLNNTKRITQIPANCGKNYTLYAKWTKVTVKKTSVSKITKVSATKRKVTVKKVSKAAGYQIAYSTSSTFKASKTKTVSIKTNSYTIKRLKKNTKYYVRVRAYKLDSAGKKVYSKWSAKKKLN